jgi:hypothetical protein
LGDAAESSSEGKPRNCGGGCSQMECAETAHFEEGAYPHSVGAAKKPGLERTIDQSMIFKSFGIVCVPDLYRPRK